MVKCHYHWNDIKFFKLKFVSLHIPLLQCNLKFSFHTSIYKIYHINSILFGQWHHNPINFVRKLDEIQCSIETRILILLKIQREYHKLCVANYLRERKRKYLRTSETCLVVAADFLSSQKYEREFSIYYIQKYIYLSLSKSK